MPRKVIENFFTPNRCLFLYAYIPSISIISHTLVEIIQIAMEWLPLYPCVASFPCGEYLNGLLLENPVSFDLHLTLTLSLCCVTSLAELFYDSRTFFISEIPHYTDVSRARSLPPGNLSSKGFPPHGHTSRPKHSISEIFPFQ